MLGPAAVRGASCLADERRTSLRAGAMHKIFPKVGRIVGLSTEVPSEDGRHRIHAHLLPVCVCFRLIWRQSPPFKVIRVLHVLVVHVHRAYTFFHCIFLDN